MKSGPFLSDARPDAYERLIDRLLASPRYGERWGRQWLDAAGYVDTTGKDFDPVKTEYAEGMWHYRDYVIESVNQDKPWDQFLTEQIAGDEMVDWRSAETIHAEDGRVAHRHRLSAKHPRHHRRGYFEFARGAI